MKVSGQTTVEYALMTVVFVAMALAMNILISENSEDTIEGRSTIGLMFEAVEMSITRVYP